VIRQQRSVIILLLTSICLPTASARSQEAPIVPRPANCHDAPGDGRRCEDKPSTALEFTADGEYVVVAGTKAIDMISRELTIEAWVKPSRDLPAGYRSIVSKQLNGTGYMLATNVDVTDQTLHFAAEVGGVQVKSTSQPAFDGWQHVAAVWDGRLKLYVNGQLDGVVDAGHAIPNQLPLYIGSSPFGSETTFRGAIDEVRIWAVARTSKQIQSTMNQRLCGDERGLRAYWPLDEGLGHVVHDAAGDSNGLVMGPGWVSGVQLTTPDDCHDGNGPR
jgi:Concanavalin A-like lectin/glucanases superfamily